MCPKMKFNYKTWSTVDHEVEELVLASKNLVRVVFSDETMIGFVLFIGNGRVSQTQVKLRGILKHKWIVSNDRR